MPGVEGKSNVEFQSFRRILRLALFAGNGSSQAVLGTIINVIAIVLGGIAGLILKKEPAFARRAELKTVLGALTALCGLRLTWLSVSGPLGHAIKQITIVLLALVLGNITGKLLHLQKASNHIGQLARDRMAKSGPENSQRFTDGFTICALLFCAAPLGILGAIHNGLLPDFVYPLVIKAVMDGLGTLTFATMFGWGVVFSAVPVLVFQGAITLASARWLGPFLTSHGLMDSVNATGGLLIFCVSMLIFEMRKVHVADYLPSLIFAPVLAWFWR